MNTTLNRPLDPASPAGRRLRLVQLTRRALVRFHTAADALTALRRRRVVRRARLESAITRVEHRLNRYRRLETVLATEAGLTNRQVLTALNDAWPQVYRLLDSGLLDSEPTASQRRPMSPRPRSSRKRTEAEVGMLALTTDRPTSAEQVGTYT